MADWDPVALVQNVFGHDSLIRAKSTAVSPLKIPTSSKTFLTEVGLPLENILLCSFTLDVENFLTIAEYAHNRDRVVTGGESLKRIGTDDGMQLCLSENMGSGNLVAFDINGQYPLRFVNANIETFAGFLALYVDRYARAAPNATDEELDNIAIDLERFMRQIDPPAFGSSECWWAVILEQVKAGLL